MASSIIKVAILGEAAGIKEAAREARKALGEVEAKSDSTGKKMAKYGAAAAGGVALVAAAAAGYAVKVGSELQESEDRLSVTLKNSGTSYEKNRKSIEATQRSSEKYGYTAKETNAALTQGIISSGSLAKAQKNLALAQNIAAVTGKPLEAVMLAVSKGAQGQIKPLKALGIDLPIAAGGALKVAKANAKLQAAQENLKKAQAGMPKALALQAQGYLDLEKKHLKGSAAIKAYAAADRIQEAAANKVAAAQDKLKAAQKGVNDAGNAGLSITDALSKKFAGGAAASAETFQGKMKAMHAQLEDTAAKIGVKLIPVLIKLMDFITGTLIPGIEMIVGWVQTKLIPALTKWADTISQLYTKYVKPTIDGIITYFKGLYQTISGIVNLFNDLIHGRFGKIWGDLKQIVMGVVDSAIGFFKAFPGRIIALIPGIAGAAVKAGASLGSGILKGITGAAGDIAHFAKQMVNALIGYINRDVIDKLDSFIGGVHVSVFGHKFGLPSHLVPHIPTLHKGGVFNSGHGEGLALLQDGERVLPRGQSSAGGGNIFNFPAGIDPNRVVRAQQQYDRRNGR